MRWILVRSGLLFTVDANWTRLWRSSRHTWKCSVVLCACAVVFSSCYLSFSGRLRFPPAFQHGVVKSNMEDRVCVKMRAQSASHTHTHSLSAAVADSSITERPLFCWLYFLFLSAGLLPLLRLPWEQDPGPTPPPRPSSSRRWWPLLTVRISLLRYILLSITMY